jgi:S1-C subfamily serine protease
VVGSSLLIIAAVLGGLFYLLAPTHWETPPATAEDFSALLTRNIRLEQFTTRPYLGITYLELQGQVKDRSVIPGQAGAMISSVVPGSPAAMAGLIEGDVILAMDGLPLNRDNPLVKQLINRRAGERVRLVVQRGRENLTLEIVLGKR